jgi:hypothetical protein
MFVRVFMQTDEKQYMQQLKGIQSRVALLIVFLSVPY